MYLNLPNSFLKIPCVYKSKKFVRTFNSNKKEKLLSLETLMKKKIINIDELFPDFDRPPKFKKTIHHLKGFKFIDLFAGIGGMRMPFDELGAKCVFSSETDKYARQTYKTNFNEEVSDDIRLIKTKEIPRFNILLAGFPCQPFSNAGLRKGFDDTRGTLFFDICRVCDHHKPEFVFLENVKHLKNHDNGKTLRVIIDKLKNIGYEVNFSVLNAKDFGLPQNRERIYIIAHHKKYKFYFPDTLNIKTSVADILESNKFKRESFTISDKLWHSHQERKKRHLEKGNGFGYCLFNGESNYTSTISARYYKDGAEILIEQKDNNPRMLTPREAARLQGFPDTFEINQSNNQAYKQFGNSVPVNVIREIAKQIAISVRNHDDNS